MRAPCWLITSPNINNSDLISCGILKPHVPEGHKELCNLRERGYNKNKLSVLRSLYKPLYGLRCPLINDYLKTKYKLIKIVITELVVKELTKIICAFPGPLSLNQNSPKSTNDSLENVNKLFFALFEKSQLFRAKLLNHKEGAHPRYKFV